MESVKLSVGVKLPLDSLDLSYQSLQNMSQQYDKVLQQHKQVWNQKELSPCEKLDDFRECVVELQHLKERYFVDPCPRNWPCLFNCHRTNIDLMLERLEPTNQKLIRECNIDMIKKICNTTDSQDSPSMLTTQIPSCDTSKPNEKKSYISKSYIDYFPLA